MAGVQVKGHLKRFGANSSGRVDLEVRKFTQAIQTKGYNVVWEKAMYCPNRKGPSAGDHAIDCVVCDGSGFLYYDAVETRMLLTSLNMQEQYFAYGRFDSGVKNVTAFPDCHVSFWDKLTLCDSAVRYTELIYRQAGTLEDKPKYVARSLVNVSWVDVTGTVVTAVNNVDVSLSDSGGLVWASDLNRPGDREHYSASYEYRPEYVITDMTHHIRDTQSLLGGGSEYTPLPVQAVARLNFLIRDEGEDSSGEDNRNNPFQVRR